MCNRFGQGKHVGEIRVPTQCADAKQNVWNIWCKIKNDYMSLRLFKLAC